MSGREYLRVLVCVAALLLPAGGMPGPARAGSGTLADCLLGCIPGDAACTACCGETFPSPRGTECHEAYTFCTQRCESEAGTRAVTCFKECRDNLKGCVGGEDAVVHAFDCPNWRRPLDCPYECQAWNPRTRKCDGAPRSSCD